MRLQGNFLSNGVLLHQITPDNPIIFASDSFLELTEYSREDILGRNCRFLQGPETDPATVRKIRDAINKQTEVTVQLINYTKRGKKFWNLFHLQPMRDQKGEVQYFIGVQLDGSEHVEPLHNCIPEETAKDGAKQVKQTSENIDDAVRELPDANMKPEDLWNSHSKVVHPKPHRKDSPSWKAIQQGIYHLVNLKQVLAYESGIIVIIGEWSHAASSCKMCSKTFTGIDGAGKRLADEKIAVEFSVVSSGNVESQSKSIILQSACISMPMVAANIDYLKLAFEDYVSKHGNRVLESCQSCFSTGKNLKVGAGIACSPNIKRSGE